MPPCRLHRFPKCHLFVSVLSLTELGKSGLMAAQKRETIVTLVRHGRWCVFRHQRPSISDAWRLRRFFGFEAGSQRTGLIHLALCPNPSARTAFSWNMTRSGCCRRLKQGGTARHTLFGQAIFVVTQLYPARHGMVTVSLQTCSQCRLSDT